MLCIDFFLSLTVTFKKIVEQNIVFLLSILEIDQNLITRTQWFIIFLENSSEASPQTIEACFT
jgi:hypothetical protein